MGFHYESLQCGGIKIQLNQLALLRALVKALYGIVITFAVLLTVITLHRYSKNLQIYPMLSKILFLNGAIL